MGNSSWSAREYLATSTVYKTKTRSELFSHREIKPEFDPATITMRESRDSPANPESTAIIVGLDVTGSMGMIAEEIAKSKLGILVEGIIGRQPVSDPHIMMMAIGDLDVDRAPLQVTQFEADIRIAEQLTSLFLEGGGGGNDKESYDLPWIFAANKTSIDCFEKRGKKGYLFTIGDEQPPVSSRVQRLVRDIGIATETDIKISDSLAAAQSKYHVFHLIIEQGSYCQTANRLNTVRTTWKSLLGKRAIRVNNYNYIAEITISVIEVNEGKDPDDVINSWENPEIKKAVSYSLFGE